MTDVPILNWHPTADEIRASAFAWTHEEGAVAVPQHLAVCDQCRSTWEASVQVRELLARLPTYNSPITPEEIDRLYARVVAQHAPESAAATMPRKRFPTTGAFARAAAAALVFLLALATGALWTSPDVRAAAWRTAPAAFASWLGATASIEPVGGSGLQGSIALKPTNAVDYSLRVTVSTPPSQLRTLQPLLAAVARGRCIDWVSRDRSTRRGAALTPWTPDFGDVSVPGAWIVEPLALLLTTGGEAGPLRGCADLPLEAARALRPLGEPVGVAQVEPVPSAADARVVGTLRVWRTRDSAFLLRADLTVPIAAPSEGELARLAWQVAEGSCAAWETADLGSRPHVTDSTRRRTVISSNSTVQSAPLTRGAEILARPGTHPDPGGDPAISLVLTRAEVSGTAERRIALLGFEDGGGPLLACGDLALPE